MKRWVKVILGILLVIVIAIAALVIWQWENVRAVYIMLTTDMETITQELETQRQEQQKNLQEEYSVTIQAPSALQSDALLDGTVSPEEIKEQLGISQELENIKAEENKKKPIANESKKTEKKQENATQQQVQGWVNQCVAELYACEVDLMAVLGGMKKKAIAQWNSLDHDTRTMDDLRAIGFAGLSECYNMEVGVDRQVKAILAKYRTKLKEVGADTAIFDTLWEQYCNKKANQKAYYLNKYK